MGHDGASSDTAQLRRISRSLVEQAAIETAHEHHGPGSEHRTEVGQEMEGEGEGS